MPVPNDYYVEPNKAKEYTPMPADKYQVMVFDVEAIKEPAFSGDGEVDKLKFTFVVLDDKKFKSTDPEGNPIMESTRGRRLWRKITRSYSPGGQYRASIFFELMCAIEKKQIAKEDLAKVQPNSLIGQQVAVFVSVNETWNNIESFLAIDEEMEPLPTILDKESIGDPDKFIADLEEGKKKTAEDLNNKEAADILGK